ncbi:MAG TPA: TraC family protein [bacterium]|nr:TraC family protein [bacterium]
MSTANTNSSSSTQRYLKISDIKKDTIIMKDGTLRAVLMVSSINFALKSEDEQEAIIDSYVSFLNNLDFPIQIIIQSRELNIANYLENMTKKANSQPNELLKSQTIQYIDYVKQLVSLGKIMNKHFYIVIPYNPMSDKRKNFWQSLLEAFRPIDVINLKEERFLYLKKQLEARIDTISGGLSSMGLMAAKLDTQGLIELFYNAYNQETAANQPLDNVEKININNNF